MKTTRIYEVQFQNGSTKKTFLIDAQSRAAAWRHVAAKYVAQPEVPDGRRIAALMTGPEAVKPEAAEEVAENAPGRG